MAVVGERRRDCGSERTTGDGRTTPADGDAQYDPVSPGIFLCQNATHSIRASFRFNIFTAEDDSTVHKCIFLQNVVIFHPFIFWRLING